MTDPKGPDQKDARWGDEGHVIRGGPSYAKPAWCRSAFRHVKTTYGSCGFRVVVVAADMKSNPTQLTSNEVPHSKLDPWEAGKLQDKWTEEARQGVSLGVEADALVKELLQISPYFRENPRVMEIGRVLWRKGGVTLMAKAACRIRAANASSSVLDAAWEGIGDATDFWGCSYEGTPR